MTGTTADRTSRSDEGQETVVQEPSGSDRPDVVVVGAGMGGLASARWLVAHGLRRTSETAAELGAPVKAASS